MDKFRREGAFVICGRGEREDRLDKDDGDGDDGLHRTQRKRERD